MVIGNFQLQDECLCHFHFKPPGFKCERTIMPLEWVLGRDIFLFPLVPSPYQKSKPFLFLSFFLPSSQAFSISFTLFFRIPPFYFFIFFSKIAFFNSFFSLKSHLFSHQYFLSKAFFMSPFKSSLFPCSNPLKIPIFFLPNPLYFSMSLHYFHNF